MYAAVRDDPKGVWRQLQRLPQGPEQYYRIRVPRTSPRSATFHAARFIYLNRFCFNGLYRTNKAGQFNVPYGGSKNGQLPTLDLLMSVSGALKGVRLKAIDYKAAIRGVDRDDFVYLDPPYADDNSRIFRQYGPTTFGTDDLIDLTDRLHCIDALGAKFVISYADTRQARHLLGTWSCFRIATVRNIAGFTHGRRTAVELLATNLPARSTGHLTQLA